MGQEEAREELQEKVALLVEEVKSLRRSEHRYRSVVQEHPDVIVVGDLDGNVLLANRAALRATGYSEEEITGLTVFQLFPPEACDRLRKRMGEVIRGGQPGPAELELVRKDGHTFLVELELRVVREESEPVAVEAVARDIAFRKSSEDALRCSRENLERVLNGISDAVLVEDADHVVQFVNSAGRALFGEAKGKRCYEVLGLEEMSPNCAVPEIVENRKSLHRGTLRRKGKVWSLTGMPLLNADGSISVLEILKDVTRPSEVEEKLSASERLAVLTRIAREMAHEVKNPLSAITTFAQLLPEKYDDEEFRRVFTKSALEAVGKINYLLEEMVNFARPVKPVLEEMDLKGVIDQALLEVHQEAATKNIRMKKDLPGVPLIVPADEQQMKRAIRELLSNSVDALGEGGNVNIFACFVGDEHDTAPRRLEIAVSDDGPGIPSENLKRVFEPFFTTSSEKLGLGLAIAQRIVGEHGGRIDVESEPGKGATFTIKLGIRAEK